MRAMQAFHHQIVSVILIQILLLCTLPSIRQRQNLIKANGHKTPLWSHNL